MTQENVSAAKPGEWANSKTTVQQKQINDFIFLVGHGKGEGIESNNSLWGSCHQLAHIAFGEGRFGDDP